MRRSADVSFVPALSSLDLRTSSSSYTKPTRPTAAGSSSTSATALSSLAATAASPAALPTTSSMILLSESTSVDTNAAATVVVFEPIVPSTETLLGMGLIVTLCIIVAYVWQTQVVPTSRTNLALSKRNGPVKEYLDELKKAGATGAPTVTETLLQSNVTVLGSTLQQQETEINNGMATLTSTRSAADQPEQDVDPNSSSSSSSSSRALERWLFTDWLQDNKSAAAKRKPGRQKPAALPILKDAKWNSGDNPVLAATLLISVGVVLTAVTERVSQVVFDLLV